MILQAVSILETFYEVENGEVENLAPAVDASAGVYSFGAEGQASTHPQGGFNFGTPMG